MGNDFGTHQRWNSSGFVHASKTRRAGASNVRVTTSSRSDFRSDVVGFVAFTGVALASVVGSIGLLLLFEIFEHDVEHVETLGPAQAVALEPGRLFLQPARSEPAGPHASHLFGHDQPGLFQNANVFLHAREGHVKLPREVRDGSVRSAKLVQNAAARWIRERAEGGVQPVDHILSQVVQYVITARRLRKVRLSQRSRG